MSDRPYRCDDCPYADPEGSCMFVCSWEREAAEREGASRLLPTQEAENE